MDEREWLASADLDSMLPFLRRSGVLSQRKARLFACAAVRRVWHLLADERSRRAVEVAERFAEGLEGEEALAEALDGADLAWRASRDGPDELDDAAHAARVATYPDLHSILTLEDFTAQRLTFLTSVSTVSPTATGDGPGSQADLLRDLVGPPPFRPVTLPRAIAAWDGGIMARLAQAAYEERALPSGHLDPHRLGALSDALKEAGCADAGLLGHLRSPGPHVRGCWALDLVLGKG